MVVPFKGATGFYNRVPVKGTMFCNRFPFIPKPGLESQFEWGIMPGFPLMFLRSRLPTPTILNPKPPKPPILNPKPLKIPILNPKPHKPTTITLNPRAELLHHKEGPS